MDCSSSFLTDRDTWHEPRTAVAALVLLLFLFLEPFVVRGHVAVPLENREALAIGGEGSGWPEVPRLSDVNRYFIPKLHLQFLGDYGGWNATWNPHVQLGRPASHFGGYSKAYPITYVLSCFSTDPYRLHAWLSVVTVVLLTMFSFLFLRSVSLHPAAAFVGAVGIGLTTRSAYWFGFAQLLAWAAWSLGIMWLCVRLSHRPRMLDWLGLAFCSYCLLIGARHQATIRMAYLVVPFVLATIVANQRIWRRRLEILGVVTLALAVAILLAIPLISDLVSTITHSSRFAEDTESFIWEGREDFIGRSLPLLWNAFAFGNPSRSAYQLQTSAMGLTPFYFALLAVAFVVPQRRQSWLFLAVFSFFLAMAMSATAHSFAIRFLGFGFSRGSPVGGLYVPSFVLCAYAADVLLRDPGRSSVGLLRPVAAALVATAIGVAAVLVPHPPARVDWTQFGVGLPLAGLAVVFAVRRSPLILYVASLLVVVSASVPALAHRPLSAVQRSSRLTESILLQTEGVYRLAKFGDAGSVLPSNQEVLVGLRSIHSYDSISSRAYGRWTRTVSRSGAAIHGRHFDRLDAEEMVTQPPMSYAGVAAILADRRISLPGWSERAVVGGRWLYGAPENPLLVAQIANFVVEADRVFLEGALPERARSGQATVVDHRDDRMRVRVRPTDRSTLLFVSSQYHEDWSARSGNSTLRTVRVNDFYLGVVLPPGTDEIELRFLPLARWAWIPLVVFAFAFVVIGPGGRATRLWSTNRRGASVPLPPSRGDLQPT